MSEHQNVALVMAASRGLGYACAAELARRGHAVAICGRSQERLDDAVSQLSEFGNVLGIRGDVSDEAELRRVIASTQSRLGPIDTAVINAGGPPAGGLLDLSLEDWDGAYHLTLRSVVVTLREIVPGMRERGHGRIVVIGSSSVRQPIPDLVLSNTFRAGVLGLVKDVALQLAPDEVTVNMVCPGRIDTDRVRQLDAIVAEKRGITPEDAKAASEGRIPMGRYGTPDELAAAVGFLASPEASYITGQVLLVDGGLISAL